MLYHFVAKALDNELLFTTWDEACALFRALSRAFPEAVAICVMPDHIHLLLPHADAYRRLCRFESGWARWRARRGGPARLWKPHGPPEVVDTADWRRKIVRYILLNPVRGLLVGDPLAWPFSTHRDRVGLVVAPVGPTARDAAGFHRYVCTDDRLPPVTPLPTAAPGPYVWEEVREAVQSMCRLPEEKFVSDARRLVVGAAWHHGIRDVGLLARETGCTPRRIQQIVAALPDPGSDRRSGAAGGGAGRRRPPVPGARDPADGRARRPLGEAPGEEARAVAPAGATPTGKLLVQES